jgi:hypothetical protein
MTRSLQTAHSDGEGGKGIAKHALLVILSLVPFGVSTMVALGTWELFDDLAPSTHLTIVVLSWIAAFAVATRGFWKAVEMITPW